MGNNSSKNKVDLLSVDFGGRATCRNDEHYGSMHNLNSSKIAQNMADGWETRRRREPGFDWVIFELAKPGGIYSVEIDTAYYKGNCPKSFSLSEKFMNDWTDQSITAQSLHWSSILSETKLQADNLLRINENKILHHGVITHCRLNIFPDGGVSRIRVFGISHDD